MPQASVAVNVLVRLIVQLAPGTSAAVEEVMVAVLHPSLAVGMAKAASIALDAGLHVSVTGDNGLMTGACVSLVQVTV